MGQPPLSQGVWGPAGRPSPWLCTGSLRSRQSGRVSGGLPRGRLHTSLVTPCRPQGSPLSVSACLPFLMSLCLHVVGVTGVLSLGRWPFVRSRLVPSWPFTLACGVLLCGSRFYIVGFISPSVASGLGSCRSRLLKLVKEPLFSWGSLMLQLVCVLLASACSLLLICLIDFHLRIRQPPWEMLTPSVPVSRPRDPLVCMLWGASSVGVHGCAEVHAYALVMPAQPAVVSAALVQKGLAGLPALCPRVTAVFLWRLSLPQRHSWQGPGILSRAV